MQLVVVAFCASTVFLRTRMGYSTLEGTSPRCHLLLACLCTVACVSCLEQQRRSFLARLSKEPACYCISKIVNNVISTEVLSLHVQMEGCFWPSSFMEHTLPMPAHGVSCQLRYAHSFATSATLLLHGIKANLSVTIQPFGRMSLKCM